MNFFYNFIFIFPSQHPSNITCINLYNSLNNGLYLHTVFELLVIYGGGVLSTCESGSYRTCCINGLGMYTPLRSSPVIAVCMAAKIKTLHGVRDTQKLQRSESMLIYRPVHCKCDRSQKGKSWFILILISIL